MPKKLRNIAPRDGGIFFSFKEHEFQIDQEIYEIVSTGKLHCTCHNSRKPLTSEIVSSGLPVRITVDGVKLESILFERLNKIDTYYKGKLKFLHKNGNKKDFRLCNLLAVEFSRITFDHRFCMSVHGLSYISKTYYSDLMVEVEKYVAERPHPVVIHDFDGSHKFFNIDQEIADGLRKYISV